MLFFFGKADCIFQGMLPKNGIETTSSHSTTPGVPPKIEKHSLAARLETEKLPKKKRKGAQGLVRVERRNRLIFFVVAETSSQLILLKD